MFITFLWAMFHSYIKYPDGSIDGNKSGLMRYSCEVEWVEPFKELTSQLAVVASQS